MRSRLHPPSPAMVVACTALAVALGGTSYAALRLPRNSVGPKQLRAGSVSNKKLASGAVTGSKVARDTLTGLQIRETTLAAVPNAAHAITADTSSNATTAATAQNLAAPEAFHLVGANGEPGFQNNWQNRTGTADQPAAFYKDREGVVHLQGRIIGGMPNQVIFQLPPGYRPPSSKADTFAAACECTGAQTTIITILGSAFAPTAEGGVTMVNGNLTSGNSLYLDGITFLAGS